MADKTFPEHVLKDAKEVEQLAEDLSPKNNRRQIPEHLFRHYFLPLLTGKVKDDRPFIIEWIAMAGSPTSEVEVVHRDGSKTIIPPLFDTRKITRRADVDNPSLSEKLSIASETLETIPAKGMSDLIQTLSGAVPEDTSDGFTTTWNQILKKFGMLDNEIEELTEDEEDDSELDELFDL